MLGRTFLLLLNLILSQSTYLNLNEDEVYYISKDETIMFDLDELYNSEEEEQYKLENVISNNIYLKEKVEFHFRGDLDETNANYILFQQNKNYLGEWSNHFYVLKNSNLLLIYDNQQNQQFALLAQIQFSKEKYLRCFSFTEIEEGIILIDCQRFYQNEGKDIFLVLKWKFESNSGQMQREVEYRVEYFLLDSSINYQNKRYIEKMKYNEELYQFTIIRYNQFQNFNNKDQDMSIELFLYDLSINKISLIYVIDKNYLLLDKFQIRHAHKIFNYFFVLDSNNQIYVMNLENSHIPKIYTYKFQGTSSILKIKGNFNLKDRDLRLIITAVSKDYIYELDCTTLMKIHLVSRFPTKLEPDIEILKLSVSQQFAFLTIKMRQDNIESYIQHNYQTIIFRKNLGIISSRININEFLFISFNEINNRLLIVDGQKINVYKINIPLCVINATDVKRFSEKQISIFRTNNQNRQIQQIYQIVFLDNDYRSLIQNNSLKVSKIYSYSNISGIYYKAINAYGNMARSQLKESKSPNFNFVVKINDILNISIIKGFSIEKFINNEFNNKFMYANMGFRQSELHSKLFFAIQDKSYNLHTIICEEKNQLQFSCKIPKIIKLFDEVHKMILLEDYFIFNTKGSEQILQIYKIDKFLIFTTYKTIEQSGKCHDLDLFIGSQENLVICTDVNKSILVLKINQYLSDISTQTIKVIDNSTLENTHNFNPQSVSISSKFPSLLFVKNQGTILLLEIGLGGNQKTRVISAFSNVLTKEDPNFKIAIKKNRLLIFSKLKQLIQEYNLFSPYEIIKVRTFHNHQFKLISMNYEDSSSKSKFVSILGIKDGDQSILIMKTDSASYHNLKDIIPLKKNEILKDIQIIPLNEKDNLIILYTNQRIEFSRLYHKQILQYTYVGQPLSNYLEQFVLQIETKSQLYSGIEPVSQNLYITLWNTHSTINLGKNEFVKMEPLKETNTNISVFKIVEEDTHYGQNVILGRNLICDEQEICSMKSQIGNESKQKIFLKDKIRLEHEGNFITQSEEIVVFKVIQNMIIALSNKKIFLINSSDINQVLIQKDLGNLDYKINLMSYDNITNNLAILKNNKDKFILEIYTLNNLQETFNFLSKIDITIFKPKKMIMVGQLLFIYEEYQTKIQKQFSCIHILVVGNSQNRIIKYLFLFDHLYLINREKINDFSVRYNFQKQTYFLYLADNLMKIQVFQILLNDQLQDLVINYKYHVNLKDKNLTSCISGDSEIAKLVVENSGFTNGVTMIILTKNSNHIEIEIDQSNGLIINIVNCYIKYNDCKVTADSVISSTLILMGCKNQNAYNRRYFFYDRKKKHYFGQLNFCYVTGSILKSNNSKNINKILDLNENKLWVLKFSNTIMQYTYQDEVLLVIKGQLSDINSTNIFIEYYNKNSKVQKKILIDQNQIYQQTKNLNQDQYSTLVCGLILFCFITIISIWVVWLKKSFMEESNKN